MNRQEMIEEIRRAKKEAETAGAIHKKDLMRYIHRMERDIKIYDSFQREAKCC